MEKQMQDEQDHLAFITDIANKQIHTLREEVDTTETDIMSAKRELGEEASHSISGSLWGSDAFEQLVELSQFTTQISDRIARHENTIENLKRMEKLVLSPYFARLDFTFPDEADPTQIYIGRISLMYDHEILIHDWRAPVASLFYRYGLGEASYEAPVGTITGQVSLKRQYEIKSGKLEYYFDANIEIHDEFLRKLLSKNASSQMKSIVETIQGEQDIAIRDDKNEVLIVQGAAGSGKTSVALHRIAYLMYKGLTNRLGSQSIVIISPNNVFEQYVSNVLPELGEENVNSFIIEELYEIILGHSKAQTRFELMEQIMTNKGPWVPTMKSSYAWKSSREFVQILDSLNIAGRDYANILVAYKALFADPRYIQRIADQNDIKLPDNIGDIVLFTKENLEASKLFFEDTSALAYLYLKHIGFETYLHIKQVVVDEAQDYNHLHYLILKRLFPNAKYTILGDISQTINKVENMSFYDDILDTLGKKRNSLITLEKSFRCTNEIIHFSSRIMDIEISAFGRDGTEPALIQLGSDEDLTRMIKNACRFIEEGYKSVGIICKSEKDCRTLFKRMQNKVDVSLFDSSANGKMEGIFILPVYLAKGLEFDVALVWGVDEDHYSKQEDRSLLYIACTRALHQLNLYYWGSISPFCNF